ncbi:hypothetical protein DPF89_00186 [Salmonella enterica subsp. enterica serovar Napoli]|nr:hypothetical protein DPF89_00186 [Salmonella enterica subsp. enterica serovar Napoli]
MTSTAITTTRIANDQLLLMLAFSIRICKLNNPMMSHIATDLRQRHVQP